MRYNIYDESNNLICQAMVADSLLSRGLGLMFRKGLPRDGGLLIKFSRHIRSYSIHSFFMRFTIDLVFLDNKNRIVDLHTLKPWGLFSPKGTCAGVLEVNAGFIYEKRLKEGATIRMELVRD